MTTRMIAIVIVIVIVIMIIIIIVIIIIIIIIINSLALLSDSARSGSVPCPPMW